MRIKKIGAILLCGAGLGFGATWNGKLMDASCYDTHRADGESRKKLTEVCAPSTATTQFAFRSNAGKVYKMDDKSNSKLASDVQSGALHRDKDGDIHALITGHRRAGFLDVNSVVLNK